MADTINCYNINESCKRCRKMPVEFKHNGDLTESEFTNLCGECFVKLTESKDIQRGKSRSCRE